jgi:hypothetical protein
VKAHVTSVYACPFLSTSQKEAANQKAKAGTTSSTHQNFSHYLFNRSNSSIPTPSHRRDAIAHRCVVRESGGGKNPAAAANQLRKATLPARSY